MKSLFYTLDNYGLVRELKKTQTRRGLNEEELNLVAVQKKWKSKHWVPGRFKSGEIRYIRHIHWIAYKGTYNEQIWDEVTKTVRWPDGRKIEDVIVDEITGSVVSPINCLKELAGPTGNWRKRSSLFLPEWASLDKVKIIKVRVEPVQNITYDDIRAEGWHGQSAAPIIEDEKSGPAARRWYQQLWDSINKKPGTRFSDNPLVYVIDTELQPQISQIGGK